MQFRKFIALLLFVFVSATGFSQEKRDQIILMSGKVFDNVEVTTVGDIEVKYLHHKRKKTIERFVDKYRVFSIAYADGTEDVIYKQDTLVGNYFTEEEMRMFVYGEQDALKYYKSTGAVLLGILYSGTGGYILYNHFFVFLVPFSFTVLSGIPRVQVKSHKVRDPKYLAEPAYILGYERTAKAKRIQGALKGSIIGVVLGFAAGQIIRE